jgi:ribA/ribD-fused uncharacterized protein
MIKTLDGKVRPIQNLSMLQNMFPRSISQNLIPTMGSARGTISPDAATNVATPLSAVSPSTGYASTSRQPVISPTLSSQGSSGDESVNGPIPVEHTHSTKIMNDGKAICFLSEEAPLSNWYPAKMSVDDVNYCHLEQFFFATRAKSAGNINCLHKIMTLTDPGEIKKIGDKIKVDLEAFDEVATMRRGLDAKFDQNPHLSKYLKDTYPADLFEASSNKFWGIGVYLKSRDLYNFQKWSGNKLGKNTLGQLLMEKRSKLLSK